MAAHLDATVSAFSTLATMLESELGQVLAQRELLRKVDGEALLTHAQLQQAFNEELCAQLSTAKAALSALCRTHGARVETLEALEAAAPLVAKGARVAVEKAKAAGKRLDEAQKFNRDVTQRALRLVQLLNQRIPVTAAAYGRHGAAAPLPKAVTTSRRA